MKRPRLLPLALLLLIAGALAEDHAVILLYHRVSDSGPESTRVTPARFAAHLELIEREGYQVMALADLLDAAHGDEEFPAKALALTFDDAYRSVADVAYPLLRERGMPFTVFVATDVIDAGGQSFMDWPTMQSMAADGFATFGPHSLTHAHLESLALSPPEADQPEPRAREIDGSMARLRSQLGDAVINAFAYPYGEYSGDTEALLTARGLYGLAQQSGAIDSATPNTRIPRFPLYSGADSDERMMTALESRPLPVVSETSDQVFFGASDTPPQEWSLRPSGSAFRRETLRCYASSGEALGTRWQDETLTVSLPPLRAGRNKVNCTAPANEGEGYFWLSRLWLIADREGQWLRQ